ncbi:metal-dependent hydrolase family protein [Microscilla marina]|uniref:Xaa-Pro dipeptidase family enzyme n=1 Tax=Microscilla marina ATCC 23134 TaxID=313606 RepID=A1ZPP7_MICM2|nr:Xaa-Pro dipeptidase family enzyme [Microscilla marina ATCC 23134]
MNKFTQLFLSCLVLWCLSMQTNAQTIYIHCGQLIDGKRDQVQQEMTIVVEKNRIQSVEKGYKKASENAQVIDLKNKTVLPGLMDMHVHLEGELKPNRYAERFTMNKEDVAFRAAQYADRTLMAGFTTVRDLGGSGVNIALRKAINSGWAKGPRVFTAGKAIGPTGGHADPTNGFRLDLMGDPGPAQGVINGVDDCRKAVRYQYKVGADVIKITATGGVLSVAKDGSRPQFTEEEIKAIVATANDLDLVTAAHAHGAEGIKRAVRAGINSIEHGTLIDDEGIRLMKKYGTYFVPTISAGEHVVKMAQKKQLPAVIVPKALKIGSQVKKTFRKVYKAGVKIAYGTDTGVSEHGKNGQEFAYMVAAGMPPMKAILSATIVSARLLRVDKDLGSVEVGKYADIIAVDEDPIKNIKTLERVTFVMKDGKVYKK